MNERGHYAVGIELQVVGLHLIEAEQIDILAGLIDALFLETHFDALFLLVAARIRVNLAETGAGRGRRAITGKVRRDGFRSRIVA